MSFSDKIKNIVEQGMAASKDILSKAGEKAKEWGEMGVLKMEIIQLRSQAQKLTSKLGAIVYETLVEKEQHSVTKDSPAIRDTLLQIETLEKQIDDKEEQFRTKGGKEEDLKDD